MKLRLNAFVKASNTVAQLQFRLGCDLLGAKFSAYLTIVLVMVLRYHGDIPWESRTTVASVNCWSKKILMVQFP